MQSVGLGGVGIQNGCSIELNSRTSIRYAKRSEESLDGLRSITYRLASDGFIDNATATVKTKH